MARISRLREVGCRVVGAGAGASPSARLAAKGSAITRAKERRQSEAKRGMTGVEGGLLRMVAREIGQGILVVRPERGNIQKQSGWQRHPGSGRQDNPKEVASHPTLWWDLSHHGRGLRALSRGVEREGARGQPEAGNGRRSAMAFVRKKGKSFYLVHNVREDGHVRQVHLACLGNRPRVSDEVLAQVRQAHPQLQIDWDAVRARAAETFVSPFVDMEGAEMLIRSMRTLHEDLGELDFEALRNRL